MIEPKFYWPGAALTALFVWRRVPKFDGGFVMVVILWPLSWALFAIFSVKILLTREAHP